MTVVEPTPLPGRGPVRSVSVTSDRTAVEPGTIRGSESPPNERNRLRDTSEYP